MSSQRTAASGCVPGGGEDFEGEGEQRVAGEDRGRLVIGDVDGGAAAAQIVVVHGGKVVVDQRVAVQRLERRAGAHGALARHAEQLRAGDHEERPQPLAGAEGGMAHRRDEARRRRVAPPASRASRSAAVSCAACSSARSNVI